ncbi:MAG: hypothetical protein IJO40_10645 [Thermoguttaceae bacterium]|nr:hypothetical protein [Thermoguttaceae bacterium]
MSKYFDQRDDVNSRDGDGSTAKNETAKKENLAPEPESHFISYWALGVGVKEKPWINNSYVVHITAPQMGSHCGDQHVNVCLNCRGFSPNLFVFYNDPLRNDYAERIVEPKFRATHWLAGILAAVDDSRLYVNDSADVYFESLTQALNEKWDFAARKKLSWFGHFKIGAENVLPFAVQSHERIYDGDYVDKETLFVLNRELVKTIRDDLPKSLTLIHNEPYDSSAYGLTKRERKLFRFNEEEFRVLLAVVNKILRAEDGRCRDVMLTQTPIIAGYRDSITLAVEKPGAYATTYVDLREFVLRDQVLAAIQLAIAIKEQTGRLTRGSLKEARGWFFQHFSKPSDMPLQDYDWDTIASIFPKIQFCVHILETRVKAPSWIPIRRAKKPSAFKTILNRLRRRFRKRR